MLIWCAEIGVHVNDTEFEKKMMVCGNGIDDTEFGAVKGIFINDIM